MAKVKHKSKLDFTKDTIRITMRTEQTSRSGTTMYGVKDHYAPAGTVDDNWLATIEKYDEQMKSMKENQPNCVSRVNHIFWKGKGQFDQPSDVVKQKVMDRIGYLITDQFE